MLLANVPQNESEVNKTSIVETVDFDVSNIEKVIEKLFKKVDGVGDVEVKLTVKSGFETIYAYDTNESASSSGESFNSTIKKELIIINEDGEDKPIKLKIKYPQYWGALIVCEGGDDSRIKLELTQAMKSLTGISADNITVLKMKK